MKPTYWTVEPATGAVTKIGPFSRGLSAIEVQAPTKAAATAILLRQLAAMGAGPSVCLNVENGAYCLSYHDGKGWQAEAGTLHARRRMSDGSQLSLCMSGGTTRAKAIAGSSFAYYASEAFCAEEAQAFATPAPVLPQAAGI